MEVEKMDAADQATIWASINIPRHHCPADDSVPPALSNTIGDPQPVVSEVFTRSPPPEQVFIENHALR
jgi:hypothetical protein